MANSDKMAPINRGSTKETLEDLYRNTHTRQPNAILRDNLTTVSQYGMAWGLSKQAGAPSFWRVDTMNGNAPRGGISLAGRDGAVRGFGASPSRGQTAITNNGLDYARLAYKHRTLRSQ